MRARGRTDMRLFRHDWSSLANGARAAFATWHDRMIAGTFLLLGLAGVRARETDLSPQNAGLMAAAAGLALGWTVGHGVRRRLAFHAYDGVLAGDALQPFRRRNFGIAWHVTAALLLAAIMLVVDPMLTIYAVPFYAIGAATAALPIPIRFSLWRVVRPLKWWRTVKRWPRPLTAGASCAIIFLVSMLALPELGNDANIVMVFFGALLFSLALTPVDNQIVQFMAVIGIGPGRSVVRLATALGTFAAIAVPAQWCVEGPAAALAACAGCALAGLILSLRILAHRLHNRRVAVILVGSVVGLLALVAYALPPALPVAIAVALWQLHRRAAAKTCLLA